MVINGDDYVEKSQNLNYFLSFSSRCRLIASLVAVCVVYTFWEDMKNGLKVSGIVKCKLKRVGR